jgi:transposase-like protein
MGFLRFGRTSKSRAQPPGTDVQNADHGEEEDEEEQRPRRSFTPEFKPETVELCQSGDRSIGQVARDFDLTETNVRTWVKQTRLTRVHAPWSNHREAG